MRGRVASSVKLSVALAMATALIACTERPQATGQAQKSHAQSWQGSAQPAYNARGWTASDQAAWDNQIRERAKGQNEYLRTGQ